MLKVSFAGQREDRNNVDKLRYQTSSLNFNNQRNIKNSINNLSKDSSTNNINFLMNVADQIKYGLNANITDTKPNNDWKEYLKNATEKSLAKNNTKAKESLQTRFKEVFENNKALTDEEKSVLSLKDSLLNSQGLKKAIETSNNDNVQNIEKNLNYFVVSSEINTNEKVQILEKLNKFMSPEYKVQKQLENKKPQILGEMLNDMVVKTAEQDMPTIKQVDQRYHGMCAAISVARKQMAYEFKPQYVDIVMQEVNADDTMEVYDISKIGTNSKVRVPKTEIDYDYADEKGYRIIDASTLNWMNIAGTTGRGDKVTQHFSAFDKKYFDTFHDAFYNREFGNPTVDNLNKYLNALEKTNETVGETVNKFKNMQISAKEQYLTASGNAYLLSKINKALANNLSELMPKADEKTIRSTVDELVHLNKGKEKEFYIVDAEEDITKKQKIANFIKSKNPQVSNKALNSKLDNIFELYKGATEVIEYSEKQIIPKSPEAKMMKLYKPLYNVASAYRSATDIGLEVDVNRKEVAKRLNLPETATKEEILTEMENKGEIVKESVLRSLQTRFNKIAKNEAVVETAEVKGQKIVDKTLYNISKEEVLALENVNKNLNKINKEVKIQTDIMEDSLYEVKRTQAQQIALETGMPWVSEGHSGLYDIQRIKILEHMTGKRFYNEENIDNVVNSIKNSEHSAVTSTNVYHNKSGGHAMYVADATEVKVKNPETGKMETKTAIMHDNSWGYAEKKNNWIDSNGLERTDYACGRGGETGYITNALWQNGTLVDDFKNKPGVIENSDGSVRKFRMFSGASLISNESLASEAAEKFSQQIINSGKANELRLNVIQNNIQNGSLSIQDLNTLKARQGALADYYSVNKNYNNSVWNNINSEKEWDKLDSNNSAKFLMEKAALALSLDSDEFYEQIIKTKNPADLKNLSDKVRQYAIKEFMNTVKESTSDKFDLNNYQTNKYQLVKEFIDSVYNPKTNEQFFEALEQFKALDNKTRNNLIIKHLTDEQLGINRKTSYETMQAYKNLDPDTKKVVKHFLNYNAIDKVIGFTEKGNSPAEMYWLIKRDLENVSTYKDLNSVIRNNYKKDKYLYAGPEYKLYDKETTTNNAAMLLNLANKYNEIMGITDEAIRQKSLDNLKKSLELNIDLIVDKAHRNKVMNEFNYYIKEVSKIPTVVQKGEKAQKIFENHVQRIVNNIIADCNRYAITKNPNEILDEYLELSISGQDSDKQRVLKDYLNIAFSKVAAYNLQNSYMEANMEGYGHELGQELLNTELKLKAKDENGNPKTIKLGSDEMFIPLVSEVVDLSGAAVAATMFSGMGLADKIMESFTKVIDFKALLKQVKNPQIGHALIQDLKNKWNFLKQLNLSQFPEAAKLRKEFLGNLNGFVKQVKSMV